MGKPILNELFETKNKHIEEVPAIDKEEFIKAVKSRRSVRNFTDEPVLEKDMRECLELTLLALILPIFSLGNFIGYAVLKIRKS